MQREVEHVTFSWSPLSRRAGGRQPRASAAAVPVVTLGPSSGLCLQLRGCQSSDQRSLDVFGVGLRALFSLSVSVSVSGSGSGPSPSCCVTGGGASS